MAVSTLSLLLVAAYLILVKAIAWAAHRYSQPTLTDFFITGRSTSTLVLVGTVIATMINTLAVTGVPALVYKGGVLYAQMFVIGMVAPALIYLFGAKIWCYGQEHNVMTQGELFGHYFNSRSLVILSALLGLLAIFPFMAIQLSAIGKVFSAATGGVVSYEVAILVSAVSIGVYLYVGGSRAVVWTDVIQALCFLLIIITSAVLFTKWSGGYAAGIENLKAAIPHKLSFNDKNTPLFIDNVLSWPFAFFLWPQLFQRMFMARSERTIKKSVGWNFLFFNIVVACTMTMGIMATGTLYGKVQDPDQLVAMMFQEFLPIGGAFIVVAVFATGMSTVDSILLTCSSIVSRDLLGRKYQEDSKEAFRLARFTALGFLVLVTAFSLTEIGRGAMAPLVTLGASFATLFLWPLIAMFYCNTTSKMTVTSTMTTGFVAILLVKFSIMSSVLPFGPATAGFAVSLFVFASGTALETVSAKASQRSTIPAGSI